MLTELEGLPDGLLELPGGRLHELLSGPTLIHLAGRQPRPLFVSVLLHGNEDSSWEAVRDLLQEYRDRSLPRAMSLLIGNVAAAAAGVRHLPGQPDYNRIWNGDDTPEHRAMTQVVERMRERDVFASIDLHNNTGLNPHYACVNRLEQPFLHLATLFSRTVVYFTKPDSVQSLAFSRICPAVTVECGKAGLAHGIEHARKFVEAVLHLNHFPEQPVSPQDYDLYHTVVSVKVPPAVSFGFGDEQAEVVFPPDLDHLNFRELPVATTLAVVNGERPLLQAWNERGEDVAEHFFSVSDGQLRTRVPVMPSMFTLNAQVIRQDCVGYLMERLPHVS